MTLEDIFSEVVKSHTARGILIPPTQVTYQKDTGGATRYIGGFYLSEEQSAIVEVCVYSPSFIFLKRYQKGFVSVSSVRESTIQAAQERLEGWLNPIF